MLPVNQRCPSCGDYFMGSDAIGDNCPRCCELGKQVDDIIRANPIPLITEKDINDGYKELFKILTQKENQNEKDNN